MTLKNLSPVLWLCAFLCSLFFINDWQLELFGAAILILFGWAVVTLSQKKQWVWAVPKSWVLRLMGLFWLLVFLSVFRSDVLNVSLMSFCFFTAMPLTFLVFAVQGNQKQFELIIKVLAIVFAGLSIWALLQFFVYSDYFGGRARHPLANPNSLAALFNLGFFCAAGWLLGARNKLHSKLALLLSLLIFGGIVATGSRGALFSLLPVLCLFLFVMRGQIVQHWRYLAVLFSLCGVIFSLTALGSIEDNSLISRVADTLSFHSGDVTSNRFHLWTASVSMIKEHGFFGTGIGTYFLYFPEFRLADDNLGAYYAHSDPLQYWVELGILGPILFYAFIFSVIGRTFQAFKKTGDITQRLLILTPFCALGAVILHTHVTFNLYNLSILFGVGFLLAAWFWATQQVLKTPVKEISFPDDYSLAAKLTAISLPFIFIGALFLAYIISESFTNKARDHLLAGELEEFADMTIAANKVSFQGNYRSYILAVNVPMSLLQEAGDDLTLEQKKEIFDQALYYLQHVRMINPRSSSAIYYLAKLQQIVPASFVPEDLKSSEEYYVQALKIDPMHLGARIELSKIYEGQGKTAEKLKILEQGAAYRYATSKAMDLYAELLKIYLEQGNVEAQKNTIEKMRNFQSRLSASQHKESKPMSQHLWGE